jgi:hypothetical protein
MQFFFHVPKRWYAAAFFDGDSVWKKSRLLEEIAHRRMSHPTCFLVLLVLDTNNDLDVILSIAFFVRFVVFSIAISSHLNQNPDDGKTK